MAEPAPPTPAADGLPERDWPAAAQALIAGLAARLGDPQRPPPAGPTGPGPRADTPPLWPPGAARHPTVAAALLDGPALPATGRPLAALLAETQSLLQAHLPAPGHPLALAHISAAPDPVGLLGSLLAAGLHANLGLQAMAPLACALEARCLQALAELVGAPALGGGLMLAGGSAAGQVAVWTALAAACPRWREEGLGHAGPRLVAYASCATHGWLDRALRLAGLGQRARRSLPVDASQRLRLDALQASIDQDRRAGLRPWLLVANAGTVGSGAVDPLPALAALARREDLWLHVDGAYGAPAAALLAEADGAARLAAVGAADLAALGGADSLALDPHKWLHAPIGCGTLLLREPDRLAATFGQDLPYYAHAGTADRAGSDAGQAAVAPVPWPADPAQQGPENSRPFRALPVWLALQAAGASGVRAALRADLDAADALRAALGHCRALQAGPWGLGTSTLRPRQGGEAAARTLLQRLDAGGQAQLSSVRLDDGLWLRACVVQGRAADGPRLAALMRQLDAWAAGTG